MGGTLAVAPGIEFQSSCVSSSKANGPSNSVCPLMSTTANISQQMAILVSVRSPSRLVQERA